MEGRGAGALLDAAEGVAGDDIVGEREGVLGESDKEGGGAVGDVEAAGGSSSRAGRVGDLQARRNAAGDGMVGGGARGIKGLDGGRGGATEAREPSRHVAVGVDGKEEGLGRGAKLGTNDVGGCLDELTARGDEDEGAMGGGEVEEVGVIAGEQVKDGVSPEGGGGVEGGAGAEGMEDAQGGAAVLWEEKCPEGEIDRRREFTLPTIDLWRFGSPNLLEEFTIIT